MLDAAGRSVVKLSDKIDEQVFFPVSLEHLFNWRRVKTNDAAKLQDEYARLVEGLQESMSDDNDTDGFVGNPCTSNTTSCRIIWWF